MSVKNITSQTIIIIGIVLFLALVSFSQQKIKEENLAPHYQEFLNMTRYIMLPQEKDVFLQLTTDRDRNIFIESFWKQRDPTAGTPRNEYKEEHFTRFNYANSRFGRTTSRPGWMTDMGRFYILLGSPISTERFEGSSDVYPTQVWYYYGDEAKGLPAHFALVFYKKRGMGEFSLYDPASDGPSSLLIKTEGLDLTDFSQVYQQIYEIEPTLAPVTLSMIPGDIPFNFQPSLDNARIMENIYTAPSKDVNPAYATHFLDYKGIVSTEYMTNFIESAAIIALIRDPVMDVNFLHFSLVPEKVSLDYYEPKDQYYCSFKLDVSLRKEKEIILQYSRSLPIYFSPENIESVQAHGISIEDTFPVIEGNYQLVILLQNSVAKEFSLYEKDIEVLGEGGEPRIIDPLFGSKFQTFQTDLHVPFKVLDRKLIVDPRNTFTKGESVSILTLLAAIGRELWEDGLLKIAITGSRTNNPYEKSYTLRLNNYQYGKVLNLSHSLPAVEFPPDYYELKMILSDGEENVVDEKTGSFIISPKESITHPIANAKAFRISNRFLYFYMLASQYEKIGDYESAGNFYEQAFNLNPEYKEGAVKYAAFLLKADRYENVIRVIEKFQEDSDLKFDYHLLKGRAFQGLERYQEAIASLLEGNKIYNADTRLLNSLGFCYYKTGQRDKALEVLRMSLRLNTEQSKVKNLIQEIEK